MDSFLKCVFVREGKHTSVHDVHPHLNEFRHVATKNPDMFGHVATKNPDMFGYVATKTVGLKTKMKAK